MIIDHGVALEGGGEGIRIANDRVELLVSTSFGPRVLRYAPLGGENVFGFVPPAEQAKPTPFGDAWHIYGGHRLWHAPEDPVLSYVPDNVPVEARVDDDGSVVLTRAVEPVTHLVKELRLRVEEGSARVVVEHRITNHGSSPVDLAVWGLSMMAPGGQAIFPNPPFVPFPEGLLPASRLVLWPYTNLGDARFRFGSRFVRLLQDRSATAPQKLGLFDPHHGWAAYALGDMLFVKRYAPPAPDATLADFGANVESFSGAEFLELETLGEQKPLPPGENAVHVEVWHLFCGVAVPAEDEAAHRVLLPLLARASGP